jgi:hypothetical protein
VGLRPEQVDLLRRRIENASTRRGSPFTLLAGNPNSGIELLLARWISPEVAERLEMNRPLVIGPDEQAVRPKFGVWAGVKSAEIVPGHLIALPAGSRPQKDTLMQLASLGFIDQLVLVTRLAQPLTQSERELAASLNPVSATVRVLIVAVPGEDPTARDSAEVAAYAGNYMRQAGFGDGRCLGAGVWFTKGNARDNTISDLGNFLRIDQMKVILGRDRIFRDGLAALLAEIENKSTGTSIAPGVAIPPGERERLVRELSTYLSALGNKVLRDAEGKSTITKETIREYCLDAIRGWAAYVGVEGHWMKYVETLRPGAHSALLAEVTSALEYVDYQVPVTKQAAITSPVPEERGNAIVERAVVEAKRAGLALVCGLTGYWVVASIINAKVSAGALPAFVIALINTASFVIAAVLGYSIGCGIFHVAKTSTQLHSGSAVTSERARPALRNWEQLESRLTAWFVSFMTDNSRSARDECRALAERLGINKDKSI